MYELVIDVGETERDPVPGVALLCKFPGCGPAHAPGRLVLEQINERGGEGLRLIGRNEDATRGRHDLLVAGYVGGDHRRRASERPRQHHPKALSTERRRNQELRRT